MLHRGFGPGGCEGKKDSYESALKPRSQRRTGDRRTRDIHRSRRRVESRYIPPSWVQPVASEKQNSETFALLRYATILNYNSDNANKLLIFISFLLFFFFRCQVPFENLREGAGRACVNAW